MLSLEYDWYNELMAALNGNAAMIDDFPEIAKIAQRLICTIEKHARLRVGVDGSEFADVGFFKKDAVSLIWQLLTALAKSSKMPHWDAYHQLKDLRAIRQAKEDSHDV
jgi:hypothetical protein